MTKYNCKQFANDIWQISAWGVITQRTNMGLEQIKFIYKPEHAGVLEFYFGISGRQIYRANYKQKKDLECRIEELVTNQVFMSIEICNLLSHYKQDKRGTMLISK